MSGHWGHPQVKVAQVTKVTQTTMPRDATHA